MKKPPPYERFVGRRLALTAKAVRACMEARVAKEDTTFSVVILSRLIAAEPGLSQRELADRAHLGGPATLRHVDRMEAEGLLVRHPDPKDRRVHRLELTAAGKRRLTQLEKVTAIADAELTSDFTPEEITTLLGYLDRLAARAAELRDQEVNA
jgi:MarR family transcriptional regulator, transcriptional regulator for hemolysin